MSVAVSQANLQLCVTDRGVGFLADSLAKPSDGHFGIIGMRERMHRLGGSLQISSEPGVGTTVTLRLRLRAGKGAAREARV